jgi:atypical dual specificity phosphatase
MTDHSDLLTEIPLDLPGKIYRSPMPFSTYDRLGKVWQLYWQKGIKTVVVLTELQEYLVHARRDLPKFYRAEGLEAIIYSIADFQVPPDAAALNGVIAEVIERLYHRERIAVHCMAGVGRTGTFLACLVKRHLDLDGQAAINWVRQFIPEALENPEQEQFVLDF